MQKAVFFLAILLIANFKLFSNASYSLNYIPLYGNANPQPDTVLVEEKVYVTADEMPRFMDNEAVFFISWLQENFNYPVEALEKRIEGKVYIQFIVDKTGEIKDAKIVRSVNDLLANEVLNTAKLSPLWTPGKIDGNSVNVIITLPVNIALPGHPVLDEAMYESNYIVVDEFPTFRGRDMEYFGKWLSGKLEYPEEAYRQNIEGEVIVSFIINEEGGLQDFTIEKSAHPLLDEETLRVIKSSPKWKPAIKDGKYIKYEHRVIAEFSRFGFRLERTEELTEPFKINNDLFYQTDQMPKFLGEERDSFQNYIQENLVYPPRLEKIQGVVHVQFDISPKGDVHNVKVISSLHPRLDKEALRVIASSPNWEPAKHEGRQVGVRLNFPVYFFMEPPKINTEEPFVIVEDMPTFRGGDFNMFKEYIAQNLKYPKEALVNGIQGRVVVQFVVCSDGRVTDVLVIRGVHKLLDTEALRLILSSPKWEPGKQKGKPVRVRFIFPINFVSTLLGICETSNYPGTEPYPNNQSSI